jgi:hypothetical protein
MNRQRVHNNRAVVEGRFRRQPSSGNRCRSALEHHAYPAASTVLIECAKDAADRIWNRLSGLAGPLEELGWPRLRLLP